MVEVSPRIEQRCKGFLDLINNMSHNMSLFNVSQKISDYDVLTTEKFRPNINGPWKFIRLAGKAYYEEPHSFLSYACRVELDTEPFKNHPGMVIIRDHIERLLDEDGVAIVLEYHDGLKTSHPKSTNSSIIWQMNLHETNGTIKNFLKRSYGDGSSNCHYSDSMFDYRADYIEEFQGFHDFTYVRFGQNEPFGSLIIDLWKHVLQGNVITCRKDGKASYSVNTGLFNDIKDRLGIDLYAMTEDDIFTLKTLYRTEFVE